MYQKLIVIVFLIGIAVSCSNNPSGSDGSVPPAAMIGLSDGRSLEYSQTDTQISFVIDPEIGPDPIRLVDVDTRNRTITMNQDGTNWIIGDSLTPMLNLIVSGDYVLHNGYYSSDGVDDSLVYFSTPAILMQSGFEIDIPWSYSTAPFLASGNLFRTNFYFSYFGYWVSKSYVGREEVIVTAGAFDAYRFDVDLYLNQTDPGPSAHAVEWFAPEIGLVKFQFTDGGFTRTAHLIRTY